MDMNHASITLVLDSSGSMDPLRTATISALNKFIEEQQAAPGRATFTLAQFNTKYWFTHLGVDLATVKPITTDDYAPGGDTALIDAMGRAIAETGKALAAMSEATRPGKVIFVVVTDGQENASREYTWGQVMAKVEEQTTTYNWKFVFLGAGKEILMQAARSGIGLRSSMSYKATPQGVHQAYAAASSNASAFRGGQTVSMDWSPQQRAVNEEDPSSNQP